VLHAVVHVPEAHAWPVAQSLFVLHEQYREEWVAVQCALGPHWLSVEQLPQVPPEQTSPAGQSVFAEQPPVVVICEQSPFGQGEQTW
jgi:hypothetical protein